jgi:hypothetical protein
MRFFKRLLKEQASIPLLDKLVIPAELHHINAITSTTCTALDQTYSIFFKYDSCFTLP